MARRRAVSFLGIALALFAPSACHRGPAPAPMPILRPATVLLLPPRNVIQDGRPHPAGAESGEYLLKRLRVRFNAKGWTSLVTPSQEFTNEAIASPEAALAEGRRLKAQYVLQVVLGEFRDAAPMTFRSDFVSLQEAHLWSVETGAVLWATNLPTFYASDNLRHVQHLLDDVSKTVVESITSLPETVSGGAGAGGAIGAAAAPRAAPEQQVPAKASTTVQPASRKDAGQCTTEQILSMKNSGLSDDQIRRACEK
jgi:hypothetical protein